MHARSKSRQESPASDDRLTAKLMDKHFMVGLTEQVANFVAQNLSVRLKKLEQTGRCQAHQKSSVTGGEGGFVGVRGGHTRTVYASSKPPVLWHCRGSRQKHQRSGDQFCTQTGVMNE